MKWNVIRANPAGNITLFVLDPVPPAERGALAERLMRGLPEMAIEQVGFRCPPAPGLDGRMEMAGGEFCGNATRAYGFLTAREMGGASRVRLQVSGSDRLVTVETDLAAGTARTEMPLPRYAQKVEAGGAPGVLVHLGGIAHLVVEGVEPTLEFFQRAEPLLRDLPGLDAYGVIFLGEGKMTPLVKVPAANSLVWEGSCGSGSLASAVAQSQDAPDGEFAREYIQPAGAVQAGVLRAGGKITAAWIGGPVSLDEPFSVEL